MPSPRPPEPARPAGPLPAALAAAVLCALLWPCGAPAQGFDGSQSLDAYTGLATGGGRVVGLGGAYVGVAERLPGASVNPASVAQRRRDLRRGWDLDGAFSGFVLDARQDLDNDGGRDAGLSGRTHVELGGGFQRGRLGLGILVRSWLASGTRTAEGGAGIETSDLSLVGGWSGWSDALVLGASATFSSGAVIQYRPEGEEERRLEYAAGALRLGALWRPRGASVRLGAFWDPGVRARAEPGAASSFPAATPSSFAFPWTAALGLSAWLGPNARRYNEPSLRELELHPELGSGPAFEEGGRAPVLLSLQLDLVGPVPHAVTVASALQADGPAQRSGERPSLVPRAGAEWELVQRWVRTRAGYYLEPSRSGGSPRSHATFGGEVRIPCRPWDLQLGLAADVAGRYRNAGLSLGFWSALGPVAPPAAPGAG